MKNKNILVAFSVAMLSLCSCKKFLEEDPKGLVASTNFFQNESEIIAGANGVMQAARLEVGPNIPAIFFAELITDDGISGGTVVGERLEVDNLNFISTHAIIRTLWTNCYQVINRANNVISFVDSSKVKPATCRRVIAESRFWRAYNYFKLVQLWGDVPLVLEASSYDNVLPSRTPSTAVYNQIIDDLKYAEINLDPVYSYTDTKNGGRPTQVAAKALLGKVYLTMAGKPLNDVSKLQLAADKLNEVITNKATYGVDLMPIYADIFKVSVKPTNKENLFYFRGTTGLPPASQGYTRLKFSLVTFNFVIPSKEVKTLFEVGDLRKAVNMNAAQSQIGKYIDNVTVATTDNADDFHIIRYSDVLMMYAETLIELGGTTNLNAALAIINNVRKTHGGSTLADLTYINQNDLRDKYRVERRKEFMYEGQRYYDLKRWGIFITTMKAHLAFQNSLPASPNYDYIDDHYNILPLPYSDITTNPNLRPQNPGY